MNMCRDGRTPSDPSRDNNTRGYAIPKRIRRGTVAMAVALFASAAINLPTLLAAGGYGQPTTGAALQTLSQLFAQQPMQPAMGNSSGTTNFSVVSNGGGIIQSVSIDNPGSSRRIRVNRNATAVIQLNQAIDAVSVADNSIADVVLTSPTQVIVAGRAFGTTQILLQKGQEQTAVSVDVELDLSILKAFVQRVAPTAQVDAQSVNGTIFLNGMVPDTEAAAQIVDMASLVQGGEVRSNLTIAGVQQTMLRVVVAEINKSAIRRLGVNWAVGGNNFSRDFFFANNLGQLNPTTFGTGGLPDVRMGQNTTFLLPTQNGPGTNITFGFPQAEFQVFVNALRENSLARVLAEPNLVAISGQTASFLAGGEVPIPVTQGGATAGAVTIEYREFGVRLAFTPTVLGGQIVRLHIMTEVSDAVPTGGVAGAFPLFTFSTRRVESTIECGNGQTFAIAGLLRDDVRGLASKIPGLGDIPILGTLFSSTDYERELTELVILVTPQLVEPLDPHQVPPPPGSLMTEPTDAELFFEQKLEGEPLARPGFAGGVPRETYPVKTLPRNNAAMNNANMNLQGPWGMAEFGEQ